MLNGYWTITHLDMWDWLYNYSVNPDKGFMFAFGPELTLIITKMEEDDNPYKILHSGSSFAYTMRCMKDIADNGFVAYKQKYIATNNKK
jgi:hypothetical protein